MSISTTITSPGTASHDVRFSGHRGIHIVRGSGAYVWDDEGRRYLDATSMYGVASIGHAHPAVARAVAEQAGRLVSCFASYGNPQREELCARLARLLAPLDRIFLCNSGTEAVEAAIKIARSRTGRRGVVALSGGFHGRTFGALSATHRSSHREAFEPLVPGFVHVPRGDIEALEAALDASIGLLLLEVVQGEGGVQPLQRDYLRRAQALCNERGVLLCIDEVQTGCGRTGAWFAHRHHDLDPDLVCVAKGLAGGVPIGAVALRAELAGLPTGSHGSTFGGNPLSCAAANATLRVIESEGLVERARDLGLWLDAQLRDRLLPLERVTRVRSSGLMVGIDLRGRAAPVQRALQQRGFLVLGAGPSTLRLLPPLVVEERSLAELIDALVEVLS